MNTTREVVNIDMYHNFLKDKCLYRDYKTHNKL